MGMIFVKIFVASLSRRRYLKKRLSRAQPHQSEAYEFKIRSYAATMSVRTEEIYVNTTSVSRQ